MAAVNPLRAVQGMAVRERAQPLSRGGYFQFTQVPTRWMDNDLYGHVNNVVYYSYFDTVVNRFLIDIGVLDLQVGATIGLVVETHCNYFSPLSFPETVDAGLRVDRLGTSSVTYGIGLFRAGQALTAARGSFTHVYVDRHTRRPLPLAAALREAVARLVPFDAPAADLRA